jgi:hypothetical protein
MSMLVDSPVLNTRPWSLNVRVRWHAGEEHDGVANRTVSRSNGGGGPPGGGRIRWTLRRQLKSTGIGSTRSNAVPGAAAGAQECGNELIVCKWLHTMVWRGLV